jgi:hypothetical protein
VSRWHTPPDQSQDRKDRRYRVPTSILLRANEVIEYPQRIRATGALYNAPSLHHPVARRRRCAALDDVQSERLRRIRHCRRH